MPRQTREKGHIGADALRSSSSVGSIAWAERFGMNPAHAYKISKAGLNMLNAQYVLEHKEDGFIFLCISPGVRRLVNHSQRESC